MMIYDDDNNGSDSNNGVTFIYEANDDDENMPIYSNGEMIMKWLVMMISSHYIANEEEMSIAYMSVKMK